MSKSNFFFFKDESISSGETKFHKHPSRAPFREEELSDNANNGKVIFWDEQALG